LFFFSSRTPLTRFSRDGSSDVCSSALIGGPAVFFFKQKTAYEIADLGYNIHDPNLADTEINITHKMFYTLPASDLPTEASGAVPGGDTWLKRTPVLPNVQDLQIKGVDGTVGQVSNKGGYIGFTADAQGQYIVEIKSDESPAAFETREIRGVASVGNNEIFWDGKDGDDMPLPQGN